MSTQTPGSGQTTTGAADIGSPATSTRGGWIRRLLIALLIISGLLTFSFAGISTYIATQLVYVAPQPLDGDPSYYGLTFTNVAFPARVDGVQLKGWVIPGVLPDGSLTDNRIIIVVHGTRRNRSDSAAGVLSLSAALAHRGYAVLALDMRGMGESAPTPFSFGYFEQRDVLGAVDFIHAGQWPYPELGRPRVIGGWGVSMGAATLLLAAAQEPAIRAVVSDCAYADGAPILEREVPLDGGIPAFFTPGVFTAARVIYGIDFYGIRPVDEIARIAPRPILLIHGSADDWVPPSNMAELYAAGASAPNAHVQQWLVPGVKHAQSYHTLGDQYVDRVVAFYDAALGPN